MFCEKTINKFKKPQKPLGKDGNRVEVSCDKSVKILSFFKNPYIF
jgi:hypothetical protein